jgi:hypothetical protein
VSTNLCGWYLVYEKYNIVDIDKEKIITCRSFISAIENLYIILCHITGGLYIVFQALSSPYDSFYLFVLLAAVFRLFFSISVALVFKNIESSFIYSSCLISTLFFVTSVLITGSYASLSFLLLFEIWSGIIIHAIEKQKIVILRLRENLDENKKLNQETNSNEMRLMIGNVAHDLKTVIIFFYSFTIFY